MAKFYPVFNVLHPGLLEVISVFQCSEALKMRRYNLHVIVLLPLFHIFPFPFLGLIYNFSSLLLAKSRICSVGLLPSLVYENLITFPYLAGIVFLRVDSMELVYIDINYYIDVALCATVSLKKLITDYICE